MIEFLRRYLADDIEIDLKTEVVKFSCEHRSFEVQPVLFMSAHPTKPKAVSIGTSDGSPDGLLQIDIFKGGPFPHEGVREKYYLEAFFRIGFSRLAHSNFIIMLPIVRFRGDLEVAARFPPSSRDALKEAAISGGAWKVEFE